MEKLKGTSMNIVQDNIEKLKQIFPDIFSEGKVNFQVLQELLGEEVETENERYSFTWHGKSNARRIAQEPSKGTLLPSKEDSKNWKDTENLYIEGDNLEVLKLLQKSYHGKVKMIYIDPPYNTGKDFVYPDNFKDNLKNYLEITGQTGEEGQKLSTNSDSSGRYHSDWLNMMYPRLKLARNLMSDDGIIFISIDDNEVGNLRKLCDEIFGEENFRNQLTVRRGAKSVQAQFETWDKLGQNLEYILFYTKSSDYRFKKQMKPLEEVREGSWNSHWRGTDRPTMRYEIFGIKPEKGQWRWGSERSLNAIKNYENMLKELDETEKTITIEKIDKYLMSKGDEIDLLRLGVTGKPEHYTPPTTETLLNSSWIDLLIGSSSEILNLFEEKYFDTAKLISVIKRMLNFLNSNDLILDFFSGSATTAHAVMQLNAEDGGNRKYIMVQLPEPTPENSEASKAGYKTICEIGKERIRRAGKKIKSDQTLSAENREKLDTGFKVFKLDTSNIKEWDSETENLRESLFEAIDNIKSDRTSLDVLYEILLKYGLDLNVPIVENSNFYSIGGGTLLVNLDEKIDLGVIDSICEEYKNLLEIDDDFKSTVVLRDTSFVSDVDKTNAIQRLKQAGIKEIRSI